MRRLLLIPAVLLAACAGGPDDAPDTDPNPITPAEASELVIGEGVPQGEALSPDDLVARASELEGKTVTVEGTVREVCQMEGCWLTLAAADGQSVRVNVPKDESGDYLFTFPEDASGERVRFAGQLAVETESVESQRHYAEDGGASADEIAAITEPRRTLVFTAIGAEWADESGASADNA